MEYISGIDMKIRRYMVYFLGLSIIFIIWRLSIIETDVEKLQFLKDTLYLNKEQLQLSHQQLVLIEHLYQTKLGKNQPMVYAITPTYTRYVQKAELTRISQTLALVPNVHWILIEDADEKTDLVRNLVGESNLLVTHLVAKTPLYEKLGEKDPRWKKHRGVEQRNAGLKWIRASMDINKDKGVVYFMDDDNTYSIKLFKEIAKVKKVGVWPVGLVGGLNAESPIVDQLTGKVSGFRSGWEAGRTFAIDMAGFAINLELILITKSTAEFSYKMEKGYQESEFLSYFTAKEELEPLADNCTKVYVWHTRTEKPTVKGKVSGYKSGWKADRPFAIDMAGFAINLELILTKSTTEFSYKMEKGYQESEFLSYFTAKEELEPLADNCTKVYVWHTRTEKPTVKGIIKGLEV